MIALGPARPSRPRQVGPSSPALAHPTRPWQVGPSSLALPILAGPSLPRWPISELGPDLPRRPQSPKSAPTFQGGLNLQSRPRPSKTAYLRTRPWPFKVALVSEVSPKSSLCLMAPPQILPSDPADPDPIPNPFALGYGCLRPNSSIGLSADPIVDPSTDPSVGLTDSSIGPSTDPNIGLTDSSIGPGTDSSVGLTDPTPSIGPSVSGPYVARYHLWPPRGHTCCL